MRFYTGITVTVQRGDEVVARDYSGHIVATLGDPHFDTAVLSPEQLADKFEGLAIMLRKFAAEPDPDATLRGGVDDTPDEMPEDDWRVER